MTGWGRFHFSSLSVLGCRRNCSSSSSVLSKRWCAVHNVLRYQDSTVLFMKRRERKKEERMRSLNKEVKKKKKKGGERTKREDSFAFPSVRLAQLPVSSSLDWNFMWTAKYYQKEDAS